MTTVCNETMQPAMATDDDCESMLISDALCFLARLVKQHNSLVEVTTMLLNRLEADRDVIERGWWKTERDKLAELLANEPLRQSARCTTVAAVDLIGGEQ